MKLDFKTDSGPREQSIQGEKEDVPVTANKDADPATVTDAFGPWMVVQRKSRCTPVKNLNQHASLAKGNRDGSRFMALISDDNQLTDLGVEKSGIGKLGAETSRLKEEIMGHNSRIGLKDKSSGPVLLEVEHGNIGKGPFESEVVLNSSLLDPKRYSAVTFKGNSDHNVITKGSNNRPSDANILSVPSKGYGPNKKKGSGRSGRVLNKTICGGGGRFKITKNSRVSLPDAMNSTAKLIGEQVEALSDMIITNDEGDKASIGL
ncbi:hypothetical protein GOBAR_AA37017 [Gossypium barbadense]|uniref:Uncharacterized protein n=1 Tax=Gossypium barbadense TaxID=3634 RepID=A0A2P5VY13_GOSBA|nr:hypothetical protein GOBAR_AA37017 [Gossypium barbadense]